MDETLLKFVDLEKKDIIDLFKIKREYQTKLDDCFLSDEYVNGLKDREVIFLNMNLAIIDEVIFNIVNTVTINILNFKLFLN